MGARLRAAPPHGGPWRGRRSRASRAAVPYRRPARRAVGGPRPHVRCAPGAASSFRSRRSAPGSSRFSTSARETAGFARASRATGTGASPSTSASTTWTASPRAPRSGGICRACSGASPRPSTRCPFRTRFSTSSSSTPRCTWPRISGTPSPRRRAPRRAGGRVAILDSPFYARTASGEAMAEEKRRDTARIFRDLAGDLLALTAGRIPHAGKPRARRGARGPVVREEPRPLSPRLRDPRLQGPASRKARALALRPVGRAESVRRA